VSVNRWEATPARLAARDAWKRQTHEMFAVARRSKEYRRKITVDQRAEVIRRRYEGEDPKDLALEFGISAAYVRNLAPTRAR